MIFKIMTRKEEIERALSEYMEEYNYVNVINDVSYGFIDGANWADEHPKSPWHSFIDGDIPPYNKTCLFNCDGIIYIGFVRGDDSLYLEYNLEIHLNINDIDYWMEIPEVPKER